MKTDIRKYYLDFAIKKEEVMWSTQWCSKEPKDSPGCLVSELIADVQT